MNFDKEKFSKILIEIKDHYGSLNQMADKTEVTAAYLSKLIRLMYDNAPSPEILKKIANNSYNVITYDELMQVCGYREENIEEVCYTIFLKLEEICKSFSNSTDSLYEIPNAIEDIGEYINDLQNSIKYSKIQSLKLSNYYEEEFLVEDSNFIIAFLFLYDSFLKELLKKQFIKNISYRFIDWSNKEDIYQKFYTLKNMELLSYSSSDIEFVFPIGENFFEYVKKFNMSLSFAYASTFDNNELLKIFKEKAQKSFTSKNKVNKEPIKSNSKFYMCPVYGKISAGIPNWAEECLEGYLPIDPNLMGIINPEECFFLKVNGESMNKVIQNGAYALIRKQDIVENGEIAAVLVNGFEATLKKFTKQGDLVILEPMSNDPSFTTQVYNKDTDIKILGKYIGKFEMNK